MSSPDACEALFILSPPHAGTTAMAKLLLGSDRIWSRIPNAEGQKLPESRGVMPADPWDNRIRWDWPTLKGIWEQGRPAGSIFLEKSPPLMSRVDDLLEVWPRAFFVISMRSPYALIASYLARSDARGGQVGQAVMRWTKRASMQRENCDRLQQRALVTTYEAFTARPDKLVRRLERVFGPLGIDARRPLEVKNYGAAPISNHNDRQIATLKPDQIELARELLAKYAAREMEFWGY